MRGWQNYECEGHDLLTLISALALLSPKLTHEGMLIFCMTAFYDIVVVVGFIDPWVQTKFMS